MDLSCVLRLKVECVVRCKTQASVIAKGRTLIPDCHAKVDRFSRLGAVVEQGGAKAMIGHLALKGVGPQKWNQAQRLEQIGFAGAVWTDQHG
jgi:hypothetical protein